MLYTSSPSISELTSLGMLAEHGVEPIFLSLCHIVLAGGNRHMQEESVHLAVRLGFQSVIGTMSARCAHRRRRVL